MKSWFSHPSRELKLVTAVAGIYVCFITFAINTEGIYSYRSEATGEKFTATLFFLLVQCITNAIVAAAAEIALLRIPSSSSSSKAPNNSSGSNTSTPPILDFITIGFSYVSAMLCSTEALKYVSLPMQALGKSCKMIPVMLFGFLIRGKKYTFLETLAVLLITAGISLFQQKKANTDVVGGENSNYGLLLLFLSLVLDGVTGACQDRMREKYRPSTHQVMFQLNLWASLLLIILVTVTGQLSEGLSYCQANPPIAYDIALASLSMAAGQNFIFFTLSNFGALALATITTTRKFFTIIVSAVFYHHHFGDYQKAGVGLVFLGLALELHNKYISKKQADPPEDGKKEK